MEFKSWDLLIILTFLLLLAVSAMYFAIEGTKNDITYVEVDAELILKYPFIIYKGEVYQRTDQVNWEGVKK